MADSTTPQIPTWQTPLHGGYVSLLMPIVMLAALFLPLGIMVPTGSCGSQPDLSRHPVYSRYDFGREQRVINFGTQPLFVPTGVIGEVMRRDRILRDELRKLGFEIRFHPFLKGDDINFFLKKGNIDVAMAGSMPTIMAAATYDIVVPAMAQQGFSSIVTRTFTTITDLKGKRIGYPPFSNAHYALLTALWSVGLKDNDVRLVPMDVNEMVEALAAKRIDAFAAWEPVPTIAAKSIGSATIYRHLNYGYLYSSRKLADHHPKAEAAILASMARAFAWMKKSEGNLLQASEWVLEAGARLQGKPIGLSIQEIAALTVGDILGVTSNPTIPELDLTDRGTIRREIEFLKARGIVPAATATEKVLRNFDRKAVTDVLTHPKKYRLGSFDYDTGRADK